MEGSGILPMSLLPDDVLCSSTDDISLIKEFVLSPLSCLTLLTFSRDKLIVKFKLHIVLSEPNDSTGSTSGTGTRSRRMSKLVMGEFRKSL